MLRTDLASIFRLLPALALLAGAYPGIEARARQGGGAAAVRNLPGFHSETWTTEQGLPGDTVRAVTQTRDGYLWVATQAGLARFDGVRFNTYSKLNEPAFRTNECNVLLEGADGSLWVGTIGGGLMRYRGGRFESFGRAEGLPTDVVNGLYEDRSGRLWITSYEALTLYYPATLTPQQFVDALNANTGGSLTQSERDARAAELAADNTAAGRASVLLKVVDNAAFRAREFNRAFVLMQFHGYLRRNPNDAPDGNFDGFNFWLGKLNQFQGNFVEAEMVRAFIQSIEYSQRFGQ